MLDRSGYLCLLVILNMQQKEFFKTEREKEEREQGKERDRKGGGREEGGRKEEREEEGRREGGGREEKEEERKGGRTHLMTMPLSMEKLSLGRPAMFHSLILTWSPSVALRENSSEQGMPRF